MRYMCEDCTQYIQNIDMQEIQESVNKNRQTLFDYKHDFESALKKNEDEIKALLGE